MLVQMFTLGLRLGLGLGLGLVVKQNKHSIMGHKHNAMS